MDPSRQPGGGDPGPAPLAMLEVVAQARRAFAGLSGARIDAVAQCLAEEDGSWRVVLDVVESPAKLGHNDLLCSYEIRVASQGRIAGFQRLGRYHREEGPAP